MKTINYLTKAALLLFIVFLTNAVNAQIKYELLPENSEIKIEGTSTVHDWHMSADNPSSSFNAELDDTNIHIDNLSFQLKAENILSHNSIMDNKAHKSLKSEDHPVIKFMSLSDLTLSETENHLKTNVIGKLQIAGVTKDVQIPVETKIIEDSQLEVTGEVSLKFKDFKIKAPTALMGSIKTGESIKISFKLRYQDI